VSGRRGTRLGRHSDCARRTPRDAINRRTTHITAHELFTTETTGLVDVSQPTTIRLHDGDYFDLRIAPARKNNDGDDLRMLAYNGSIPGPNLHVDQGSE